MTRAIPTALATHLAGEATTLCTCISIVRKDGVAYYMTDLDIDLPVGGQTYLANRGYTRSAIASKADYSVPSVNLAGFIASGSFTELDVRQDRFNEAQILQFLVNYERPQDGIAILLSGQLGNFTVESGGRFKIEVRGKMQQLRQRTGLVYGPKCRVNVGDPNRCKVPIDPSLVARNTNYGLGTFVKALVNTGVAGYERHQNVIYECTTAGLTGGAEPTWTTTIGGTITDGTVVWTARPAWSRHGVVASVTNANNFSITVTESRAVDNWFRNGQITFESGNNNGLTARILRYTQAGTLVTLRVPLLGTLAVGDRFRISPGCDNTLATCRTKWVITGSRDFNAGNGNNFRWGYPHLPGQGKISQYPDAT